MLEKGQPGNSEAPQQAFKKKKTSKIDSVPEKNNIKGTKGPTRNEPKKIKKKEQRKTKITEIFSHQEENQTNASELQIEADSKSLRIKRKKKRKNNNKYKGLNIRQKEERMAQANLARDTNEPEQQDSIMNTKKGKEAFQAITSMEEAQSSHAKEFKRKKKKKDKSKLLEYTHNTVPQEDSMGTQKNSTETLHQNGVQDVKVVNSHGSKINPHHLPATSVGANKKKKKKKSINKNSDTILSNGNETQSCLGNNGHQNAYSEDRNKVKGEKSGEGYTGKNNGIGSSMSIYKSGEVRAEVGTKNKNKKKKKEVKANGNLLKVKDMASDSRKAKLKKQQLGGNCSKKVKQDEKEELVFDSNEECSEEFKKDLGALLSTLNFSPFKTAGSGKEKSDDNDDTDLEGNNRQDMSETKDNKDSTKWGSEGKGRKKGLTEKRKKVESAKTSHKKINGEQKSSSSQVPTPSIKKSAKFNREKLAKLLEKAASIQREKASPPAGSADTLKQRMEGRLMAARFR